MWLRARMKAVEKLIGYAGIARLGRRQPYEYEVHTIGVDRPIRVRASAAGCLPTPRIGRRQRIFLEVRTDNVPAIALYESDGFVKVGVRKRYYRVSGADAYTMNRPEEPP